MHTRRRKSKEKHNTICVGHHYTQTNTNNVNKTCILDPPPPKKREKKREQCGNVVQYRFRIYSLVRCSREMPSTGI